MPVRYSIRNQNLDVSFHAKEALNAVYQPSEMENLFQMNETAQQTAMLLRSKLAPKLKPNDFEKVLKVYDHFVLVKLNRHGSQRFGGAEQVAVSMRSMTNYSANRQAHIVRELLHKLKEEARAEGRPQLPLMFTESYVHARNRIKKQINAEE